MDEEPVGVVLRRRRTAMGLTLAQVAGRIGCHRSYLSNIESGHRDAPSAEILGKLAAALGLDKDDLARRAAWARTPEPVRRDVASLRAQTRGADELTSLIGREGLDEAYRSGKLGAIIDRMGTLETRSAGAAFPHEVPVINRVTAGYPADFTDLDYPARVADEYVRCPDLHDPDAFAARVVGDSMEPEYREGDIVVFSPIRDPESGTDCFVRLEPDHESTFKRIYFETGEEGEELIRIQPINNRYPPQTVPRERVAGLYRAVNFMRSVP